MKTTIYFRDAKSDKVYSAWLKPFDNDLYDVAIEYGRRGGNLARGIKTPDSLPLADAQKVLDRLIAEKMAKGYTLATDGKPFDGDVGKIGEILPHPRKEICTLQTMRNFSAQDYLIQKKFDGIFAKREIAGAVLLGELVTSRSGAFLTASDRALIAAHGSFFAAFTVASVHGENVLTRTTRERWGILCSFVPHFPPDMVLCEQTTVPDKLTTEEGYVAHAWGNSWGEIIAVKQSTTYLCRVTKTGGTQSVGIERIVGGENLGAEECRQWLAKNPQFQTAPAGNCKFGGGACDQVTAGQSFVRIEGMGLTDDNKIRQPTKARDWKL